MTAQDVHNMLKNDRAYIYSRENNDYHNMMIVLRAHGFNHTIGHAKHMVDFVPEAA